MRSPRRLPLLLLLVVVLVVRVGAAGQCAGGEWRCAGGGGACIALNKFCDGVENCDDGSDEPIGCTNCNRTFYGEANVKYPLRVTGPFQRYLPFVCQITFVAAGKEFGDFVELTFLSFQIGRLELTRNQTSVCQKGHLKISEWSSRDEDPPFLPSESPPRPHFGEFCGSMVERSVTFFSQGNNVSVLAVVPSRASIPSTSFGLYLTYRFLKRRPSYGSDGYLGTPVSGTYCDREFLECHSNRRCKIRTPNFPGFYPRNITCNYFIRQPRAPEGYVAKIVVSQANDYKISVPVTGGRGGTSGELLSTDCGGDAVRVHDGASAQAPLLLSFCGAGPLPPLVASGPRMLVQLRSAPFQLLRSARLELDVAVRYELVRDGEEGEGCSRTLDGGVRRWGVIRSPSHSMPAGANCTYRLIGASKHDRIWLYFVSFFVLVEKRTPSEGESSCSVSRLEMVDPGANVTHLFCGETGPRLCAHAADYPPRYLPPRPCEVPGESYLSQGSELVLRHRFLSFASELASSSSSTSSFVARYEFVDTRQQGTALEPSACDRRLDSRLGLRGALASPRNVLLFGRGGRSNASCLFHFVGRPGERLRITLRRARLPCGGGGTCGASGAGTGAWLSASEHWGGGLSAPVGCVCGEKEQHPLLLESLSSPDVKLQFEAVGMGPFHDFEDFFFEADYEFVNVTWCEQGLRRHEGGGEGVLSFRVPPAAAALVPSRLRCRWKIEASSPNKHLYLKFKGFNASSECRSRLLVHLDPGGDPVASACVEQRKSSDELVEFDIFSHAWRNASRWERDRLFVELDVSPGGHPPTPLALHWLEVTRPYLRTQSGQTLRNVDCLFECPGLGACIDPELWCDGVPHCPSGADEANCFPLAGAAAAGAATTLLLAAAAALLTTFAVRRRRRRRKKKPYRDYCVESPNGG